MSEYIHDKPERPKRRHKAKIMVPESDMRWCSDGFEFGFGAEIGISTQKLHARGPMGLNALTTTKYIIYGNGQVRA